MRLSRRVVAAYAAPAFAFAMPTIPVYVYLPAFYGDKLVLGLAVTGAVLMVARIFDVLTDPLIGALSDRGTSGAGHRRLWIAVGAPVAAVGLLMLFGAEPGVTWGETLLWLLVLYLGWTAVMVPYAAWGAELSGDYYERARLTSARETAGLVGLLVAGAIPAAAAGLGLTEAMGLSLLCWIAVALGAVALVVMWRIVPDAFRSSGAAALPEDPRQVFRQMLANGPFLRLLAAWFVNGLANGLPAVVFMIYLEHGLGAGERLRPAFIFVYFLAAALSMPLWQRLLARRHKHGVWCGAMLLAVAAFALVPLIPPGAYAAFLVVCIVTGASLGADLALPPALQADVADLHTLRHGRARAGLYFAAWSMATKLALAISAGIGLGGLAWLGFDPASPSDDDRWALLVIYAAVPVVLKVISVATVWRYPLTPNRQAVIRKKLERRLLAGGRPCGPGSVR